ncbi:MAG: MFS transporter [Mariprofundaceae bacterium]
MLSALHHIRLFYAAYFGAMGLILPFFPVWLVAKGWDTVMIGVFTSLLALTRVLSPPVAGMVSDRTGKTSRLIFFISIAAALFSLVLPSVENAWFLALFILLFGLCWSAVLPLADGISILCSENGAVDYGELRLWGSIGFVLVTLAGGAWLIDTGIELFPYGLALLFLLTAIASTGFPPTPLQTDAPSSIQHHQKAFIMLLVISFLMQCSHGAYYGFYSLYLLDIGFSGWQVALLWVVAVMAEILVMWRWSRALRHVAPHIVFGICLLLATIRWFGIAYTQNWGVLLLLQFLHAASFAAFHISAVMWVRNLAPANKLSAAQGWYSATGFGLGTTVGIVICGWVSADFGYSTSFVACAFVTAAAIPLTWVLKQMLAKRSDSVICNP